MRYIRQNLIYYDNRFLYLEVLTQNLNLYEWVHVKMVTGIFITGKRKIGNMVPVMGYWYP
jgi:hypothetical protein